MYWLSQLIYSCKIKDALDGTVLWSVASGWLIYCYILTDLYCNLPSKCIVAQVGG